MKRALVQRRNGAKQFHWCIACRACDHRVDMCASRAAKDIQKLKHELEGTPLSTRHEEEVWQGAHEVFLHSE